MGGLLRRYKFVPGRGQIVVIAMSTPSRRRLMRDFKRYSSLWSIPLNIFTRMQDDPPEGISASPDPDNLMSWEAVIFGCACFM